MPAYRSHVRVNLIIALPLCLWAMNHYGTFWELTSFAGAFSYGTLYLHPDLDLARQVRLFSLKGLLTLPFRPYSYLFRHRGISHIPIVGTLTRIAWIFGLGLLVFSLFGWAFPNLAHVKSSYVCFALIGLAAADLFHVLLDYCF